MRKKIVAGNWKMNKTFQEADELMCDIDEALEELDGVETEVIVCPPFVYLELAKDIAREGAFFVGAQNLNDNESGAFTGEVSAPMLKSLDIDYVIIGHSERRAYFKETHEMLARKVDLAISHDLCPIFCCGELLPERNAGMQEQIVKKQLEESLFHLPEKEFQKVVIAYEPVWAIGTGVTATSEQAQEMHAFIRGLVIEKYGKAVADDLSILYGGSCNSKNAKELFANPDVDGGLIGGASLKSEEFIKIIKSF